MEIISKPNKQTKQPNPTLNCVALEEYVFWSWSAFLLVKSEKETTCGIRSKITYPFLDWTQNYVVEQSQKRLLYYLRTVLL